MMLYLLVLTHLRELCGLPMAGTAVQWHCNSEYWFEHILSLYVWVQSQWSNTIVLKSDGVYR